MPGNRSSIRKPVLALCKAKESLNMLVRFRVEGLGLLVILCMVARISVIMVLMIRLFLRLPEAVLQWFHVEVPG